jgi:hypothetical protein
VHVEKLWKAAFAICGLSGVAAFVFWSLYKQWLTLSIFTRVNQNQTFVLMLTFLSLTFVALIVMLFAYLRSLAPAPAREPIDLPALQKAWEGVRAPNREQVDVDMAHRALNSMNLIAWYWKKADRRERKLISEESFTPFQQWYTVLSTKDIEMSDSRSSQEHMKDLRKTYEEMGKCLRQQ